MGQDESYFNLPASLAPIPTLPTGDAPESTLKTIEKINPHINELTYHICILVPSILSLALMSTYRPWMELETDQKEPEGRDYVLKLFLNCQTIDLCVEGAKREKGSLAVFCSRFRERVSVRHQVCWASNARGPRGKRNAGRKSCFSRGFWSIL
nr:PREDICTED: LOW QUALITY PROTEIN: putative uncharacterized protein C8orf44 homolog [Rhinolophus sinicus]